MLGVRTLARTLLAGTFLYGGLNALRNAEKLAPAAGRLVAPIADQAGVSAATLVKVNGGAQIAAGVAFAAGIAPRAAALVLAASTVPTTLAGHRFWEHDDPALKAQHTIHALKNAGLVGGLLFAALDTGGRPSVFWSARRAASSAADGFGSAVSAALDTVTPG